MRICLGCGGRIDGDGWRCDACAWAPETRNGVLVFAPELVDGDGYDAEYSLPALLAAESNHFWFSSRRELILWALRRHFPRAASFFDLGCGAGYVLAGVRDAFPGISLVASDLLTRSLAYARERLPGVPRLQVDARRMPFQEEFDVIGAFDILEHVLEDDRALAEIGRALRPGGGLLVTVPQHRCLWSDVDEHSGHRRRYLRGELTDKIRRAGLEVLTATSFFSFSVPLILARRMGRRRTRAEFDPPRELEISRSANAVLAGLARLERALIELGARLPFGASLLVVARRPGPVTAGEAA